ncbi:DUF1425 domain-containing protein [Desulfosediminicola flagellatus]|uniref:DUF1425 domain-containing protein n=1 Tax=Desulfosediminicola flagellatus TaxID=2569541 RepID=UPI0010ABDD92|nr:DUF1425 domain-containing protein [Desulfosediminicola flagellatus]
MGNRKREAIGLLAFALVVSGCTPAAQPVYESQVEYQEVAQLPAVDNSFPGIKRVIASDTLLGNIEVTNPKLRVSGRYATAQVTLQNLTQNRYELEYQYEWEDADAFSVAEPRPWKRLVLGPQELKNYSETSLRQEATQAVFTIRLVDDTFIELNKQLKSSN